MTERGIQAGNAFPVAIAGAIDDVTINASIDGSVETVRQTEGNNSVTVNGSTSPTISKDTFAAVSLLVSANFTGTRIRYLVSFDDVVYAYLIDGALGTPYEDILYTGNASAFQITRLIAYPYFRIAFVDNSGNLQVQTNVIIRYGLSS